MSLNFRLHNAATLIASFADVHNELSEKHASVAKERCRLCDRVRELKVAVVQDTKILVGTLGAFSKKSNSRELPDPMDATFKDVGLDEVTRTFKYELDI